MKKEILIGALGSVLGAVIIGTAGILSNWGKEIIDIDIESGAIVAFDTNQCPDGWKNISELDQRKFSGRALIVAGPATVRASESQSTLT